MIVEAVALVVPVESGRWLVNQGGRDWMPSLEVR